MIDQDTIQKILDSAQIVDVVSDFVSLKQRGTNFICCCPFHTEKTPSFSVSPAKNIYKCFGCGKGGNSVNFVMEHEQMSYYEALKYLANKYHIEVREKELTPEEKERHDDRESMMVLNEFAKNTFIRNMIETDEGRTIGLKYFKERGFSDETINTYELGFCLQDRHHFTNTALKSGYKQKYLTATGLSILHDDGNIFDRFSNRVMFPIHNLTGKVIGFGGRVLDARTKGVSVKYMNSPESEIYSKRQSLYGIYQAKASIVRNNKCFLVEGYTDVLSMHQSGIENVVASNGTALTIDQIRLIHRFTNNVTVLYDGDAAGIHAALRGIDMLLAEEINVKVLLLPDGEDPDSFARNNSSTALNNYIDSHETDFILFKVNLLIGEAKGDPVKMASLISDIATSISVIPDSIKRTLYVRECSEKMNIEERVLHMEINKLLRKHLYQSAKTEETPSPTIKPAVTVAFNNESAVSLRCAEYEKEILHLLISYGNDTLFTVANKIDPSYDVSVAQYIMKELDGLKLRTPVCQRILDIYTKAVVDGIKPDVTMFTLNADAEISQFAVNMLLPQVEVSKFWDARNKYIPPEKQELEQVVNRAIYGYKSEFVQSVLDNIEQNIGELESEPNNNAALDSEMKKHAEFSRYKNEIAKFLGRIIVKI